MLLNRIRNEYSSGKVSHPLFAPVQEWMRASAFRYRNRNRVLLSRKFLCGSSFTVMHYREGKYFALKLNSSFISFHLILRFSVAHTRAFWATKYISHLFSTFSQAQGSMMLSIQSPHNASIWACISVLLSVFWKSSIYFTYNSLLPETSLLPDPFISSIFQ